MDWEPVPAGTLPPAALTARGADHDLDFAAGDAVEVALGAALLAIIGEACSRWQKASLLLFVRGPPLRPLVYQ